jgi:hypothetical protein
VIKWREIKHDGWAGGKMAEEDQKSISPPELSSNPTRVENPAAGKAENEIEPNQAFLGLLPGLVLILLGGLFLLSHAGYLEGDWWQYFIVGLAVVFMLEAYLQYRVSVSRRAKIGRLTIGLLMVISGLLALFDPNQWWPWVLIAMGIVLSGAYLRRRQKQSQIRNPNIEIRNKFE